MPGIPLLNLGYGLGGLVQGFQQQQDQSLQQSLRRLALQQAQSQQNAQNLAGLALQAGLLNQRGGGGPLQPINISAPQSAPAAPQAPASDPQVAPQQTYTPPSPFSLDDARVAEDYPPIYAPGPGQPDIFPAPAVPQAPRGLITTGTVPGVGRGTPTQAAFDAVAGGQQMPAASGDDDQPPPLQQKPITENEPSLTKRDSSTAPSTDGGDTSSGSTTAPASGGGGVGIQFGNGPPIDVSEIFQRVDYQKLAQGIARLAPPGTSQADIYAAVTDLAKLSEGDKVQQQQAGLLLRELLGIQGRLVQTGMTTASREGIAQRHEEAATGRTETTVAGAGERTDKQIASREKEAQLNRESREKIAADSQQLRRDSMNIRNENDKARIQQAAQRIAISAQNAGRQEIALQIQSISRQISTIKSVIDSSGNSTFTDAQRQQLKTFSDRIAALAALAAEETTPSGP